VTELGNCPHGLILKKQPMIAHQKPTDNNPQLLHHAASPMTHAAGIASYSSGMVLNMDK
jgi:hypothetical protein